MSVKLEVLIRVVSEPSVQGGQHEPASVYRGVVLETQQIVREYVHIENAHEEMNGLHRIVSAISKVMK